jgi:hypothetical protein
MFYFFYGFLSVLAWFAALFFTVLRIDSVVYCRMPCRFVAGKLLQLAVLLAEFIPEEIFLVLISVRG